LADILQLAQSTLSSHLQVIRKADLLESERCEKWVYYKVGKEFRTLLGSVFRHFETDPAQAAKVKADAKSKTARLAMRDDCDCRGPKTLPKLARQRSKALAS
jgi:DNA-binding transcriptional ArsR family regulator